MALKTAISPRDRKEAWLLTISQAIGAWPLGFLSVVLPIYLKRIGIEPVLIGSLYTISGISSSILILLVGPILDRLRKKPYLIIGTFLPFFSFLLIAVFQDFWTFVLASALGGIGLTSGIAGAFLNSTFSPLMVEKVGEKESTRFFGYVTSTWLFALTLGSLCGALPELLQFLGLNLNEGYRLSFFLCALFTLIATLLLVSLKEEKVKPLYRQRLFNFGPSARTIWKFGLMEVFVGLGMGFIVQLLSLWFFLKFQVGEAQLSPWFALSNLAAGIAVYAVPKIEAKRGKVSTVLITQGLCSLFSLLMVFAGNYILAALFYALRTAFTNMAWPVQNALLMGLVPRELRSSAVAIAYASSGLFSSLAPLLGGYLMQGANLDLPIILGAISFAIAAFLIYLLFHREEALKKGLAIQENDAPEKSAELRDRQEP